MLTNKQILAFTIISIMLHITGEMIETTTSDTVRAHT